MLICFTKSFFPLIYIFFYNFFFYSKVSVILPNPWNEVSSHFHDTGCETKHIQGDGFYFISSLVEAMQSDHNIILEKSEAQDLIIDQAIENSQQYSLYHFNKTLTQDKPSEY